MDTKDFLIINNKLVAFYGNATDIVIPSSVTSIGDSVFEGCSNLQSVVIPNSVTNIGDSAFDGCSNLRSIVIPNSVTSIGSDAFSLCINLQKIYYEGTMDQWCNIDFSNFCSNPMKYANEVYINGEKMGEKLIIPETVKMIGQYTFYHNRIIKSVTILSSVTSIGSEAFSFCTNLQEIYYEGTLAQWCNIDFGWSGGNPMEYAMKVYINGQELGEELIIPAGIKEIKENAFYGNKIIKSITIPSDVTSIGVHAFKECSNLQSIVIPSSVISIGCGVFEKCSDLQEFHYEGTLEQWCNIEFDVFDSNPMKYAKKVYINGQELGEELIIPAEIKEIKICAFAGNKRIKSVTIPSGVTSIEYGAFEGCNNLQSVVIPNSVTSIGDSAFDGCSNLQSVVIPNSVKSIGDSAFDGCSNLQSIVIPNSVKKIGYRAFDKCDNIESIIIPWDKNIKSKGLFGSEFSTNKLKCVTILGKSEMELPQLYTGQAKIIMPDMSIKMLNFANKPMACVGFAQEVFSGKKYDNDIYKENCDYIQSQRKKIYDTALQNVELLRLMSKEKMIDKNMINYLIDKATNNKQIEAVAILLEYQNNNTIITLKDKEKEFNKQMKMLDTEKLLLAEKYKKAWTFEKVKDGIQINGYKGFDSEITVPDMINNNNVVSIGEYAFSPNAQRLQSDVKEIREGIKSIIIPNTVRSIGDWVFYGCSNLQKIVIPSSVTSMGNCLFRQCNNLQEMHYEGTLEQWCNIDFCEYEGNPTEYAKEIYINGQKIDEELIIPEGVKEIKKKAFSGNKTIKSVTIPSSVISIGVGAFEECSNLQEIHYEGTLAQWCNIDFGWSGGNPMEYAMKVYINGQELGEELIIPAGIKEIKGNAFYGNKIIKSITIPSDVTSIGVDAFKECSNLQEIHYEGTLAQWCNIDFGSSGGNPMKYAKKVYINGQELGEELIIPAGIKEIKENAFYGNKIIKSVTIPSGVISLGYGAFEECSNVKKIEISNSVTRIARSAFEKCINLQSIVISSSVASIGDLAFDNCINLQEIHYEGTLEQWCNIDFYSYHSNPMEYAKEVYINGQKIGEELIVPDGVIEIKKRAFYGNKSIKSITIPSSVTSIGKDIFYGCENLETIQLPWVEKFKEIGLSNEDNQLAKLEYLTILGKTKRELPQLYTGNAKIILPNMSIKKLNAANRTMACIGFAQEVLSGRQYDNDIYKENCDYILSQIKTLSKVALQNIELLQFMFKENMLGKQDIEQLKKKVSKYNSKALKLLYQ